MSHTIHLCANCRIEQVAVSIWKSSVGTWYPWSGTIFFFFLYSSPLFLYIKKATGKFFLLGSSSIQNILCCVELPVNVCCCCRWWWGLAWPIQWIVLCRLGGVWGNRITHLETPWCCGGGGADDDCDVGAFAWKRHQQFRMWNETTDAFFSWERVCQMRISAGGVWHVRAVRVPFADCCHWRPPLPVFNGIKKTDLARLGDGITDDKDAADYPPPPTFQCCLQWSGLFQFKPPFRADPVPSMYN